MKNLSMDISEFFSAFRDQPAASLSVFHERWTLFRFDLLAQVVSSNAVLDVLQQCGYFQPGLSSHNQVVLLYLLAFFFFTQGSNRRQTYKLNLSQFSYLKRIRDEAEANGFPDPVETFTRLIKAGAFDLALVPTALDATKSFSDSTQKLPSVSDTCHRIRHLALNSFINLEFDFYQSIVPRLQQLHQLHSNHLDAAHASAYRSIITELDHILGIFERNHNNSLHNFKPQHIKTRLGRSLLHPVPTKNANSFSSSDSIRRSQSVPNTKPSLQSTAATLLDDISPTENMPKINF